MISNNHSEYGGVRRIEVVQTGRRRRWSDDEKLRILEGAGGGVSLLSVARRHDIAASQIYAWRRILRGQNLLPEVRGFAALVTAHDAPFAESAGRMEIRCRNGRSVTVGSDIDAAILARVVAAVDP